METSTLKTILSLFKYYKSLGEKSIEQLNDIEVNFHYGKHDNSVAQIVKHLGGNMKSRFTDFYTSDGEKSWRNRDSEFIDPPSTVHETLKLWNSGWSILLPLVENIKPADLSRIVYIRNEGHTTEEALLRQVAHYASHIGQIVYLAKSIKGSDWKTLSIAKGQSQQFNQQKFDQEKTRKFFTR